MADERWIDVAAGQHGVLARRQLTGCGLTSKAVRHAVAKGRLQWLSPRVLKVSGSADTSRQRAMAAVLDVSSGALALDSALAMWGVPGWMPEPVHVLTNRRPHRGGPRLGVVHSSVRLSADDVGLVEGIPVTTPTRTLLDLSLRLHPLKLEHVCDDLLRRRLMPPSGLLDLAARLPERGGPAGYVVLRRLAEARPPQQRPTDSRLEQRFEEILDRAGDAAFERQVDVGDEDGWIGRVDFADRRLRVIVEIQSDLYHSSVSDRRRDAARIARMRAAGWIVVEITEDEIFHHSDVVLSKIRAARSLARPAAA